MLENAIKFNATDVNFFPAAVLFGGVRLLSVNRGKSKAGVGA